MKINYRVKDSKAVGRWAKRKVTNKSWETCDMCGGKLWTNHEGKVCCGNEHTQEQINKVKRRY